MCTQLFNQLNKTLPKTLQNSVTSFLYPVSKKCVATQYRGEIICKKAVSEAEKIVGYPTSFLNLRWLLNDEVANIVYYIRKLIGTNHPLLATARNLILGDRTPTWGLIVLLISKAGEIGKGFTDVDKDITAGILHTQRVLAEISEMIRTSNILHNSVLNIYTKDLREYSDLNFGNMLSLLAGDYLLSSSFREMSILKNQEINELISTVLRDMVEAEFIQPRDKQNRPMPAKPLVEFGKIEIPIELDDGPFKVNEILGNAKAEWTLRHFLAQASLLAKFCQATLKLANHDEEYQKCGNLFGRHMALAWQAHYDIGIFEEEQKGPFSLISAPLMFHLQHDPDFYSEILKGAEDVHDCDFERIHETVRRGPGIAKAMQLKEEHVSKSFQALQRFKDSEAKKALENIVKVL
ncbi:all trans-polyprenyl-diphosphate synthase PDSS2-like [Euwallacea fornicatus]|uniref:all trans-polyprenyl-diphosphate synthase PDSS2-like n=1 Tax=Euwallacea fornicatus TaxID=995702 RepID=UPI0033906B56